jgi:hypothetical protein
MADPITQTLVSTILVLGASAQPTTYGVATGDFFNYAYQPGITERAAYDASLAPFEGTTTLGPSVQTGVADVTALQSAWLSANVGNPNATYKTLTILSISEGTLVTDQIMVNDMKAGIPKSQVQFVEIEDEERGTGMLTPFIGKFIPVLNYTPLATPVTPYNLSLYVKQYDGLADFPNNPLSPGYLLAVANALIGAATVHTTVITQDISQIPKADITTSTNKLGGVTTTYMVPTPTLPLVSALQKFLPAQITNGLNKLLKPVIDSAYSKKVAPITTAVPLAANKTTSKIATKQLTQKAKTVGHTNGRHRH